MTYGSLCTGIGGLDLAYEQVTGDQPAWFCEADPHARRVLARHWPDVPIHHDLKTLFAADAVRPGGGSWRSAGSSVCDIEPVDTLIAGYPCQPFSHAGKRRGDADPRHLWPYIFDAVRVLRPRQLVCENVAAHLGLGFGRVLADLASIGFDAQWTVVRASDVGAAHRRARLFFVATERRAALADAENVGCERERDARRRRPRPENGDGATNQHHA